MNFTNPLNAFFTLIVVATGESFSDIMDVLGQSQTPHNHCVEEPKFSDFQKAGMPVGCGSYMLSYAFFGAFVILVNFVFLNLFVAIILNGYFETTDKESQAMNSDMLGIFKDAWSAFDPDATGFIKIHYFADFMFELQPPLGWGESFKKSPKRQ
jgi:hypothetical protein